MDVDSAGAFLTDDIRRRVSALRDALPAEVAVGIHEHNNLSLAVANSVAAIEEGATFVDTSLAGLGAGAGNTQTEALVAVLSEWGSTRASISGRCRTPPTMSSGER